MIYFLICSFQGTGKILYGGDKEDRTPDPLRARQVLSQLSYVPIKFRLGFLLLFRAIEPSRLNSRIFLPRKEVIQPHLPVRLPCYDFTPVTDFALGSFLLTVG